MSHRTELPRSGTAPPASLFAIGKSPTLTRRKRRETARRWRRDVTSHVSTSSTRRHADEGCRPLRFPATAKCCAVETCPNRRLKSQDNVRIRKIRLDHGHALDRKSSVHRAFKGGGRGVPPQFSIRPIYGPRTYYETYHFVRNYRCSLTSLLPVVHGASGIRQHPRNRDR